MEGYRAYAASVCVHMNQSGLVQDSRSYKLPRDRAPSPPTSQIRLTLLCHPSVINRRHGVLLVAEYHLSTNPCVSLIHLEQKVPPRPGLYPLPLVQVSATIHTTPELTGPCRNVQTSMHPTLMTKNTRLGSRGQVVKIRQGAGEAQHRKLL